MAASSERSDISRPGIPAPGNEPVHADRAQDSLHARPRALSGPPPTPGPVGSKTSVLIVAGEASADRYAARLVGTLRAGPGGDHLQFFGTGGDRMQAEGVELLRHVRELASIGPWEALLHLRKYLNTYRELQQAVHSRRPAVAVLLDFPEFNLRLAKRLKLSGVPVIYYIGPQLWAWRSGRVRAVREWVDRMLVILPFEEGFYRDSGVRAEFVGHPLVEDFHPQVDRPAFLKRHGFASDRRTIAVLPGSRWREVEYLLPLLLESGRRLLRQMPVQFAVSSAPSVDSNRVRGIVAQALADDSNAHRFRVVHDEARDILANADFGWVKCGTSTLEAALTATPFLIVYRVSLLSWQIGNILIRSPLKGLVNLIAQEEIVPELLQSDATPGAIAAKTLELLESAEKAETMRRKLVGIRERLGSRCATEAVAGVVRNCLGICG